MTYHTSILYYVLIDMSTYISNQSIFSLIRLINSMKSISQLIMEKCTSEIFRFQPRVIVGVFTVGLCNSVALVRHYFYTIWKTET